jgi:unsaturated rhamnogalacturonyl hydrolase
MATAKSSQEMKTKIISIWVLLLVFNVTVQSQHNPLTLKSPVFNKDTLSILAQGAIGDGLFSNTLAIQQTIDKLAARGGGIVVIPRGVWLSGPIVLKSNINLHLMLGAMLVFTTDFDAYPLVKGNWEGLPQMRNQSPIAATGQTNIAITGKGIIDGNGDAWRMVKREKMTDGQWKKLQAGGGFLSADQKTWYPTASSLKGSTEKNPGVIAAEKTDAYYASVKDFLRPNMVVFTACKNILLEGVTFQNSPAWCLHPLMSEQITVRNITVKNPWYAQNGDGIDLESCTNVLIENSIFDVGDDALCMKSGRDEAGRKRGMPTQQVSIRNCTVYSAHGGFVVGSEMSGGVRNVKVDNCSFIGTDIGLRFKTARGRGGVVENVYISNIQMKNIPGEAILFDMYYMAKDPVLPFGEQHAMPVIEKKPLDETTPVFKNIKIRNVYCDGAEMAIFIRGLPEMQIQHLTMQDMAFRSVRGIEIQEANNVTLKNIKLDIKDPTRPIFSQQTSDITIDGVSSYSNAAKPLSQLMSETAMRIWPDSFLLAGDKQAKWRYDQGVILKGMDDVWNLTGERKWFTYIQQSMDHYVGEDGSINGYKKDEYNIDHINNGKVLLMLYQVTGKEKYRKAIQLLRNQLLTHPRTKEGGFWHKNIYPHQMWLDGLYMGQPFMAEYAKVFGEDSLYNDIVLQFRLMEKYARDPKTGLLYHGWDESRQQRWANKQTGVSPHFWARSLGWFGMALVDVLDHFPVSHPGRKELIEILNRFTEAVIKVQDTETGLWYDIVDMKNRKPNYPEASGSSMLTYTIARASRLGYIPSQHYAHAEKAYGGIKKHFILDSAGSIHLKSTVTVSGLGGNPYRDGSFEYYMSEPVINNDPKGMGAFILCAAEMEMGEKRKLAAGKKVYLDNYFNNEWRVGPSGKQEKWHYVWGERDNGGYSMLGRIFQQFGAETILTSSMPTATALKDARIYIMVDPDTQKETASPNYMNTEHATVIRDWVKDGGVLVLLGNDSSNNEIKQFNTLSKMFGIEFNEVLFNPVLKDQFEMGAVHTPEWSPIFGASKKLFIKELSTLKLSAPAVEIAAKDGQSIMAISKLGKGLVFALGDPWIYNEYLDGRRLPADFENYAAVKSLIEWLLKQCEKYGYETVEQKRFIGSRIR